MLKRALLACVLAAGAAQAETDTKPALLGIHECESPGRADRQEVTLGFIVSESGTPTDLRILQSSGNAEVDQRVTSCVARFTYRPATHNGVAVASPYQFTYHWTSDLSEMPEGIRKAFARLEHDADRRCRRLYPLDRLAPDLPQPISLVVVSRDEAGVVQMAITQSAGERADKNAMACLKEILPEHDDLPAHFSRRISIDWSHHRR